MQSHLHDQKPKEELGGDELTLSGLDITVNCETSLSSPHLSSSATTGLYLGGNGLASPRTFKTEVENGLQDWFLDLETVSHYYYYNLHSQLAKMTHKIKSFLGYRHLNSLPLRTYLQQDTILISVSN